MRSHITGLCIVLCLCLVGSTGTVFSDSFSSDRLFTLSYGSTSGQLGVRFPVGDAEGGPPAGPTDIAVGRDGSIYIADRVNKRIQRFDASGELLMEAKAVDRKTEHVAAYERGRGAEVPPHVNELDNIQRVAVDSQGCAYVQFGAAIDLLAKFAADGQGLWYMHLADAIPLEVRETYGPFFGNISIGPADTLCMRLSGRSADGIAILDADGRFLRTVSGYACTPNGRIVAFARPTGASLATAVRMYDTEGLELISFFADPVTADPTLFADMDSFSGTAFDGAGNLYKLAMGVREQRIDLSPQLTIGCDEVVVRFDQSGRATAGIRFPGSPFPAGRHVAVDQAGNIYRLAYGADSVDIVRYALDTSTPEYTSLRDD